MACAMAPSAEAPTLLEGEAELSSGAKEVSQWSSTHSVLSHQTDSSFCVFRNVLEVTDPKRAGSGAGEVKGPQKPFRPTVVEVLLWSYTVLMCFVGRIPFCLFSLHMVQNMSFTMLSSALTLALYCFGRLLGAHVSGNFVGSAVMVSCTLCGVVGWGLILMLDNHWAFISGAFILGLTETISGVETMLKIESILLRRKATEIQAVFRGQLIATNVGDSMAFLAGGILYQQRGIRYTGYASLACSVLCCLALAGVFTRRRTYRQYQIRLGDIMAEHMAAAPKGRQSRMTLVGGQPAGPKLRATQVRVEGLQLEVDGEDADAAGCRGPCERRSTVLRSSVVAATECSKTMSSDPFLSSVVLCFFFNTIGVSLQSAVSALYWKDVWSRGPDFVGMLLACGELLGIVILVVFSHPRVFSSRLTRPFGKPMNVLCSGFGMGFACFVVTMDNVYLSAVGTVWILGFNTCVQSFQAELIAVCAPAEHFGVWISRCYMMKRLANGACIIFSSAMYDLVGPRDCYRISAVWLCSFAGVLTVLYSAWWILPAQLWLDDLAAGRRAKREREETQRVSKMMEELDSQTEARRAGLDARCADGGSTSKVDATVVDGKEAAATEPPSSADAEIGCGSAMASI